MTTTVLVLMGGPDAERPVSLMSGAAVAESLRSADGVRVIEAVIDAPSGEALRAMVQRERADVVFPVLHGRWGEGGALQDRLETITVPYVGSNPAASRLAMDKQETKRRLERLGVRTPDAVVVESGQPCPLDPPLVLKPVDDGSSVDLRICRTPEEVRDARAVLHPRRGRLLAERYVAGRELTVGVVGGRPLPIIEIVPAVSFYDYEAKYTRDDTQYLLNPDLPAGIVEQVVRDTMTAWEHLGLRDLARADFMLDDEGAWFLEVNTMPGFTNHSLVPMAAREAGIGMEALCLALVHQALRRAGATASI